MSSKKQESSIDSQIEVLKNKVLECNEVLYDIGSGFNFKRRQFKAKHYEINKALRDAGEGHRCRNWEDDSLTIKMITDYIYEQEGLKL